MIVVSKRPEVLVFGLLGIDFKVIREGEDVESVLEDIMRRYKVVIVDDELSSHAYRVRGRISRFLREPPLLVIMPSLSGSKSRRYTYLRELANKAIGAKLKW